MLAPYPFAKKMPGWEKMTLYFTLKCIIMVISLVAMAVVLICGIIEYIQSR